VEILNLCTSVISSSKFHESSHHFFIASDIFTILFQKIFRFDSYTTVHRVVRSYQN